MTKVKLGLILCSFLLLTACSEKQQSNQQGNSNSIETELVSELDSLSNELSTASDSVEQKTKELQATIDDLDN